MILLNVNELTLDKVHNQLQTINAEKTLLIDQVGLMELYQYSRYTGKLDKGESLLDAFKKLVQNKSILGLFDNIILICNEPIKDEIIKMIEQFNKVIYKIENTSN